MKINIQGDCYQCIHRREYPGNAHIGCRKPDPHMTGDPHGVQQGWFRYPLLFDPIWKTADCAHFEKEEI